MGNVSEKIQYTVQSIEDIRAALLEKGKDVSSIPALEYGNIIRSIKDKGEGQSEPVTGQKLYNQKVEQSISDLNTLGTIPNNTEMNIVNIQPFFDYIFISTDEITTDKIIAPQQIQYTSCQNIEYDGIITLDEEGE